MASVSANRAKVPKAAGELFSRKGFQGTSTLDNAQQACVAKDKPFRHFTIKEPLKNRYLT